MIIATEVVAPDESSGLPAGKPVLPKAQPGARLYKIAAPPSLGRIEEFVQEQLELGKVRFLLMAAQRMISRG